MSDTIRERILIGGAATLRSLGVEGFSMELAASNAGVSRKTLYNHFSGKFALLDAIIARSLDQTIQTLRRIAEDDSLDFVAKLNLIVERGFREARDGTRILRPSLSAGQHAEAARHYGEIRVSLRDFILRVVDEALRRGILRSGIEPLRTTYAIINMVEGLLYLDDTLDEPFTRLQILEESLRIMLTGILSVEGEEALRDSPLFTGTGGRS